MYVTQLSMYVHKALHIWPSGLMLAERSKPEDNQIFKNNITTNTFLVQKVFYFSMGLNHYL